MSSRKSGGIQLVSTRFSLNVENGQADAGRDGQARFGRPSSQARTGAGKIVFPSSTDNEQDWQPYQVDPYPAIWDYHT